MNIETNSSSTFSATAYDQRTATEALGVFLSPKCQKRYERLHNQKVLEFRQQLEMDNWYARCFPR